MKLIRIIGLLCAFGAITSCNIGNYNSEIAQVNRLLNGIEASAKKFSPADTVELYNKHRELSESISLITSTYKANGDTLNREEAFLLAEGLALKTSISNLLTDYRENVKNLIFVQKQLQDLRHDLELKLIEVKFVSEIMKTETKRANEMNSLLLRLSTKRDSVLHSFNQAQPQLTNLITKRN